LLSAVSFRIQPFDQVELAIQPLIRILAAVYIPWDGNPVTPK